MRVASVIQHSANFLQVCVHVGSINDTAQCIQFDLEGKGMVLYVVSTPIPRKSVHNQTQTACHLERGRGGRTHRSRLWEGLHKLHPLGVDLDQSQQVPGLHRLTQVHHLGQGRRTRLPGEAVVHVLRVDELLPCCPGRAPMNRKCISCCVVVTHTVSSHCALQVHSDSIF